MLAFANQLGAKNILHRHSLTAVEDGIELVNENLTQGLCFLAEHEVHLLQSLFILLFLLAVFGNTRIEFLVDDNTIERRTGLEGCILHISGFVTEDSLEQFLLRARVSFSLRRNLTDKDVTRLDVRTDTNDTILIEVLGRLFRYIRDVGGELLHTALGVTHFEQLLNDMHRGVHILADDTLGENDSILVVITLPRNIRNLEVLTQREFTGLCSISFGQDLSLLNLVSLANKRMKVDGRILVRFLELRHFVFLLCGFKGDNLLLLGAVILNADIVCVHIGHGSVAFCNNLRAAVGNELLLDAGTYDR